MCTYISVSVFFRRIPELMLPVLECGYRHNCGSEMALRSVSFCEMYLSPQACQCVLARLLNVCVQLVVPSTGQAAHHIGDYSL